MFLTAQRIIAGVASFFMMLFGVVTGIGTLGETVSEYKDRVNSVSIYENTLETAYPQTDIYKIISNHFNTPTKGKTKKCIVIGYDGCRADALTFLNNSPKGAINTLMKSGGKTYLSYCGGVNYPAINKQDTSTAPGWCSMLTGVWADVHGVRGNGIAKSNDHLTLLTTLVESKKIDNSAFYVSWGGHFSADDATYKNEVKYCQDKKLDVTFLRAGDDKGTYENVMKDVKKADCSDFIFSIFEYPDHAGHDTGFSLKNKEYEKAFYEADATAANIISAIKSRSTYASEDWLIILTSDHGGFNRGHGLLTIQERMTFITTNKPVY